MFVLQEGETFSCYNKGWTLKLVLQNSCDNTKTIVMGHMYHIKFCAVVVHLFYRYEEGKKKNLLVCRNRTELGQMLELSDDDLFS